MQTGNVITAYGGTRETPSAARALRIPGQHRAAQCQRRDRPGLAVGNDTLAKYFPGALFMRNVLAGGVAARYPADNLVSDG